MKFRYIHLFYLILILLITILMFVIKTNNYDFNNPFLKVCAETSGGWIFPNIKEYYAIDEKGHKKQVEPFAIKSVDKYDFQNDIFWGESKGDLPNLNGPFGDVHFWRKHKS